MGEPEGTGTILIGIDDSPQARGALRWADGFLARMRAGGSAARGVILAVWSPPVVDFRGIFDDGPFEEAAIELLDRIVDELDDPDGFDRVAVKGSPALTILDVAARREADLIVVGSRGRSAIAQVLLGSVSRHVAARSGRPVAIIPEQADGGGTNTVVAYDGSPGARAALRWAIDNVDGPITVVTAWSLPTSVVLDTTDSEAKKYEQATEQRLTAGVKEVCHGVVDDRIETRVIHGDPRLVLLDPDLDPKQIVVGQRGHHGVSGMLLGSTVNYIAGHSTRPVIVVPPSDPGEST